MSDKEINYKAGDVTIVWKPHVCIHSTKCWKELPGVFQPREKPWVKTDGASPEKIVEQVGKCPSGALSIKHHHQSAAAVHENKVEITPNGPILVHGATEVKHTDGRVEKKENRIALCRCGASANKPYCDGTHGRIDFKG
ncbi:MAG: (4Fe-4S)-binding protein [Bacteroidia bacterium]